MGFEVKIIADSISPSGKRITTMQLRYPRFIHSELMTHRHFSRNAASSRAIPVKKMLEQVTNEPATPVWWGKNQPGMQAKEQLEGESLEKAKDAWIQAGRAAVDWAQRMSDLGLHKQIANRILEPWMWMSTIVTATEWHNFYALRCHPDAQPEFQHLANLMLEAHKASKPRLLEPGDWHAPYWNEEGVIRRKHDDLARGGLDCSAARCARVSYLNHDGAIPDIEKDKKLAEMLWQAPHASPFEHQATPIEPMAIFNDLGQHVGTSDVISGNFVGWKQYRKTLPNECHVKSALTVE